MFSLGVPMLTSGDEMGRTQHGNNNAYCQDNQTSWIDWGLSESDRALLAFTRKLVAIRRSQPVLKRRRFLSGRLIRGTLVRDVAWLNSDGREMDDEAWQSPAARCLGMRLDGHALAETDDEGRAVVGDTLLILYNAGVDAVPFKLPAYRPRGSWLTLVDTAGRERENRRHRGRATYDLQGRSVALLRLAEPGTTERP